MMMSNRHITFAEAADHRISVSSLTMVNSDKQEYVRLCTEMELQPYAALKDALSKSSSTGCLNLQGISLSVTTCQILSKVIATSTKMKKLDVSNCMMPSIGASHILHGLACNETITEVDMSSNNLQTNTAMKIGAMLRKTSTIKRLFLQWNSLGSGRDSFAILCDGLEVNQSLEELDLRNNQIGPSAVKDLATAIRCNKKLHNIDLRWNALGPADGRELLSATQASSNLVCLQLEGNSFDADLVTAIELAAAHNGEIMQLAQEWQARVSHLSRHSVYLEERDGQRASGVRLLLQHQGSKFNALNREHQNELKNVQDELNAFKTRVETLESLMNDKNCEIETLQEMNQELQENHEKETEQLEQQILELREELNSSSMLAQQLQSRAHAKDEEIEKLQHANAELNENFALHNSKCADVVKAAEDRALLAMQRVKEERLAAEERLLREKKRLESSLEALERTKIELEAKVIAERKTQAEALTIVREQAAEHEAERVSMLQATMAALITEKNALNSQLVSDRTLVTQLRQELEKTQQDFSREQLNIVNLREELSREKVRCQDLQQQVADAAARREDAARLEGQLSVMHTQLNTLQTEKESQVQQLTELVTVQEKHLAALRLGEAERAGLLCSAVTQYLTRVGSVAASVHEPFTSS